MQSDNSYNALVREGQKRNLAVTSDYLVKHQAHRNRYIILAPPKDRDHDRTKHRIPLFFVHGAGNDALFPQSQLLLALALAGHWVCSFDLDGHGRLSQGSFDPNELSTTLGHLIKSFVKPKEPFGLIGFSLGAAIALDYLAGTAKGSYPAHARPTLISFPFPLQARLGGLLNELTTILKPHYWSYPQFYGHLGPLPAFGPFLRQHYPIRYADPRRNLYQMMRNELSQRPWHLEAKKIKAPSLWIASKGDRLTPPSCTENLSSACTDAQFKLFENETHFSLLLAPSLSSEILRFYADDKD